MCSSDLGKAFFVIKSSHCKCDGCMKMLSPALFSHNTAGDSRFGLMKNAMVLPDHQIAPGGPPSCTDGRDHQIELGQMQTGSGTTILPFIDFFFTKYHPPCTFPFTF